MRERIHLIFVLCFFLPYRFMNHLCPLSSYEPVVCGNMDATDPLKPLQPPSTHRKCAVEADASRVLIYLIQSV